MMFNLQYFLSICTMHIKRPSMDAPLQLPSEYHESVSNVHVLKRGLLHFSNKKNLLANLRRSDYPRIAEDILFIKAGG